MFRSSNAQLLLLLAVSMGLAASPPAWGYGNPVGRVCISETPNLCPETPAIFTGNPADNLTVHVVVQGSDSFTQFRVLVQTDASILDPLWVDVSENVLSSRPAADVFALCINGIPLTGSDDCLPQDGPGVVDLGATGLSVPFPGATGLLFRIGFKIIGNTYSTPIEFAADCSDSSESTGLCVTLQDTRIIGASQIMPATVQAGAFENAQYSKGDFAITAAPASMLVARGMISDTKVSLSSLDGFTGTISLTVTPSSHSVAAWLEQKTVTLSAGQTFTSKLTISSVRTIDPGPYTVTVVGTTGPLSHSVDLVLTLLESQTISLVRNGGFDSRFAFWQYRGLKGATFLDPADPSLDKGLPAFKITNSTGPCTPDEKQGTQFVQIEGSMGSNGFIEQYLTVPSAGALLAFHTWGQYRQNNPALETVTIVDYIENRFTLDRFAPLSTVNDTGSCTGIAPVLKTYDLSDFSGQTIRLRLGGEADGCCSALVLYDDVQVVPYGAAALPGEKGPPDFVITATPDNVIVIDGTVLVEVYVVSFNNFASNISLQVTGLAGLATSLNATTVNLQSNQTRVVLLSLWLYGDARSAGNIEIRGYAESLTRSAPIFVNAWLWPPDYTIRLSPSSLVLGVGTSTTASIRLTSIRGFARDVSLSAQVLEGTDNAPLVSVTPNTVKLESFASTTSQLKVSTVEQTPLGNYTILLTSANGFFGITHYVIIFLTVELNPPSPSLVHSLTHDQTTYPEESLPIANRFANTGPTRVRITNVLIATDFGYTSWSSTSNGGPIELDSGQEQTLTMVLAVPSNASLGNHAITARVDWQYFYPRSLQLWHDSPQLVTYGSLQVGSQVSPPDGRGNGLSGMLDTVFQSMAKPETLLIAIPLGLGMTALATVLFLMLKPKKRT